MCSWITIPFFYHLVQFSCLAAWMTHEVWSCLMEGFTGMGCVCTEEEVLTAALPTGTGISVLTVCAAVTTKGDTIIW